MALVSELRAVVTADTGLAEAKLNRVGLEIKKLGESGSTNLQKFGGIARNVLMGVGVASLAGAAVSVKAYMDEQKVLAQLQNAIAKSPALAGASAAAFEAQAKALENLTARSHDETLAADTVLTRFNLTQKQIEELAPHIADMAQKLGTAMPTAALQWGKAMEGNTRALKSLGINMKGAQFEALTFQQQVDLLASHTAGAAAAFAGTDAGKIDILKNHLKDTEQQIGKQLIPILDKMLGVLSSALGWFTRLSPATQGWIIKIGALAGAAALLLPKLISIVTSLAAMGPYGLAAAGAIAALGYAMATNETFAKSWGYQLGVIAGNLAAVAGLLHTVTSGLSDANFAAYGGAKGKAVKGTYAPGKGPLGKGYASGTSSADPGWHPVGEHGPELVNFRGGEQVVPAGGGEFHLYLDGVELAYVLQRRGVLRGTRG